MEFSLSNIDDLQYSYDWGMYQAKSLVKQYENLSSDSWHRKDVLEFGCGWGYTLLYLLLKKKNVNKAIGVDLKDFWNNYYSLSRDFKEIYDQVELVDGDILVLDELKERKFDTILNANIIHTLSPSYLESLISWFYKHLNPKGKVLTIAKTVFNTNFYRLPLKTPYAHLLFPEDELLNYLGAERLHSWFPYSGSTYIMLFKRMGFNIDEVIRIKSPLADFQLDSEHRSKLSQYNEEEFSTSEILISASKPSESISNL